MNEIMSCPQCGIEITDHTAVCPRCNAVIDRKNDEEVRHRKFPSLDENSGRVQQPETIFPDE